MRFGKPSKGPGADPPPPTRSPGTPTGFPPEFVEARAFLMEISRIRRTALFSASAGLGYDDFANGRVIVTRQMNEAWRRLAGRSYSLVVRGASGAGKTMLLRYLAYHTLVDLREPAFFLEVQSSQGRAELEAAAAVPGILFLDNSQRNLTFVNEVAKRRPKGSTVAAAYPPDESTTWHWWQTHLDFGVSVTVTADELASTLWETELEPLMSKQEYELFRRQQWSARLDLWTVAWAIDGCIDHVKRLGALTGEDVKRIAAERAAGWIRRGLPATIGVREVASALLPVTVFSQFEIPVPRSFLIEFFSLDERTVSKLITYGELALVDGRVGLQHRSLARLYASAIRDSPDLVAHAHPTVRGQELAATFAAMAKQYPEDVLDALARLSQGGGALRAQRLLDHEDIRNALLAALRDREIVRRAIPAMHRLAGDVQALRVQPSSEVLAALCAGACDLLDGPAGPERLTAMEVVSELAEHLSPAQREGCADQLVGGVASEDFGLARTCTRSLVMLARAASDAQRADIVDSLLAISTKGTPKQRAAVVRALSDLAASIPVSRAGAVTTFITDALLGGEKEVVSTASLAFSWHYGLIRAGEHAAVVKRILAALPGSSTDHQDEALRAILELIPGCAPPVWAAATRAVLDLALERRPEDLYALSSFVNDMLKQGRLGTAFVEPAIQLTLRMSRSVGDGQDEESDDLPRRAACDDMVAYAKVLPTDLRLAVVARLLELLEDSYEYYKWGEDAMTSAADALKEYFPVIGPEAVRDAMTNITRLFTSERERVREVAVICAANGRPHLPPEAQPPLFEALVARMTDEESNVCEQAASVLGAWAPSMPTPLVESLGQHLDRVNNGQSSWDRGHAFTVACGALGPLAPTHRAAALQLIVGVLQDGWTNGRVEALGALARYGKTAEPAYWEWLGGWLQVALGDSERDVSGAALRVILTERARLSPGVVRAGLDSMVLRCSQRDDRDVQGAAALAAELAREQDAGLAIALEAVAIRLCASPNVYFHDRGLEIARFLPVRAPNGPPSELPAAIAVALSVGRPSVRAKAVRLLEGRPDLRDGSATPESSAILRDVVEGALEAIRSSAPHERSDAARLLAAVGAPLSEDLEQDALGQLKALAQCGNEPLRISAFEALRGIGPNLSPAARSAVSMFVVQAAGSADAQTGRAALHALNAYVDDIPPEKRTEACLLLLDGRGLQLRWSSRERLSALWDLSDAIPEERRHDLASLIGKTRPDEFKRDPVA